MGPVPRCSATRSCTARSPGGQAEYLRVPQAQYGPIKVPEGPPDERFLFLSDVLPTAWQAVRVRGRSPTAGTVAVLGLGPIGEMAPASPPTEGRARCSASTSCPSGWRWPAARHRDDRPARSRRRRGEALRERTGGRGPDSVIDAVGMEAHGSPVGKAAQHARRSAPGRGRREDDGEGWHRPPGRAATAIDVVRRGGTISISGVYGGMTDPMPMMSCSTSRSSVRMGQANVKRWIDDIMPLVTDDATRSASRTSPPTACRSSEAPKAYEMFQKKQDGAIKVVLQP